MDDAQHRRAVPERLAVVSRGVDAVRSAQEASKEAAWARSVRSGTAVVAYDRIGADIVPAPSTAPWEDRKEWTPAILGQLTNNPKVIIK